MHVCCVLHVQVLTLELPRLVSQQLRVCSACLLSQILPRPAVGWINRCTSLAQMKPDACEVFLAAAQACAPVCNLGFTSGSASVACKQMGYSGAAGFAGCRSQEACGGVAPQLADLACAGSETSVLQCLCHSGTTCSCAPEESVLLSCSGHGDPIGKTDRSLNPNRGLWRSAAVLRCAEQPTLPLRTELKEHTLHKAIVRRMM